MVCACLFEHAAHGFVGDRIERTNCHHAVGQQRHRPRGPVLRRLAAPQRYQECFLFAIELGLPTGAWTLAQCRIQPGLRIAFAHPVHGERATMDAARNGGIALPFSGQYQEWARALRRAEGCPFRNNERSCVRSCSDSVT